MLWVVVPALNEAENLRELVPRIVTEVGAYCVNGRVLIVDDGSTDDTGKVVAELMAEHDAVELESHRHNLGKAAALQNGFRRAIDAGATTVVMMDADGQDDPREIGRLLEALEDGADLVTGARLDRQDRFVKRTTSKLYNSTTSALSGVPGKDFNSGLKGDHRYSSGWSLTLGARA